MPTALITGPTSGIGWAYAGALARRGYDLVLVARDVARLGSVAETLSTAHGVGCEVLPADLADAAALRTVEERLSTGETPVDLLVNNAGFTLATTIVGGPVDDEERLLDVHVRAVLRLTMAALPRMVERRTGAVVNISSIASFVPYGTYGAVKAWVTSFSEGLAAELVGTGVRVVAVCPGYVRTEFHERSGVRVHGLPSWMWLEPEEIVEPTLRYLDSGRTSPVLIPTLRYRVVATASRHGPRVLVRRFARALRMRRR
jgi:uncharacterized protein